MKNRLSLLILLAISNIAMSQNTILWKVSDSLNIKTSYIVGTLHQMGNSFIDSIPEIKQYLYDSEIAIFESIDSVDKIIKSINNREISLTIRKVLKKNDYSRLLELSGNWNVDIHKLTPLELRWKLEQEFVKIKCETVRANDQWDHFDYYLQHLAKANGLEIIGLETNKEQLDFIKKENSYPNWTDERKDIRYLIGQFYRTDYNKNKCDLVEKYRHFQLDYKLETPCSESILIKSRNKKWMTILPELLNENNCFVAVGFLHLYYKCGILEQLKSIGFNIEPIQLNPIFNSINTKKN